MRGANIQLTLMSLFANFVRLLKNPTAKQLRCKIFITTNIASETQRFTTTGT